MPPKKQICKEEIIDKAFEIVRQNGISMLSARNLAKELHCSTQPIYLVFNDMTQLKNAIAEKAICFMQQYISNYTSEIYPPGLSKILGYVQFAIDEQNLYKLIFSSEIMSMETAGGLAQSYSKSELDILIYAHGIIMMKSCGTLTFEWEQIREMIIRAYNCFQ